MRKRRIIVDPDHCSRFGVTAEITGLNDGTSPAPNGSGAAASDQKF
jgi:hypothetical protein